MTAAQLSLDDAIAAAEADRDAAFADLDAADTLSETDRILAVIARRASLLTPFSANDVRAELDGVNTMRIGRAFAIAAKRGLIEFHAYVKSTDRGTHGKRLTLWKATA